jgi:hypothetical protein
MSIEQIKVTPKIENKNEGKEEMQGRHESWIEEKRDSLIKDYPNLTFILSTIVAPAAAAAAGMLIAHHFNMSPEKAQALIVLGALGGLSFGIRKGTELVRRGDDLKKEEIRVRKQKERQAELREGY